MSEDDTMSYITRDSQVQDRSFYEGEMQMKTGPLSKTKIFASILKNDATLYFIDIKKVPRAENGQIVDRVDPYYYQELKFNQSLISTTGLSKDWQSIDLDKCQIIPSQSDKKCFKFIIDRSEKKKSPKDQRFITSSICSRNIWVKKLLLAKSRTFDGNFQGVVPLTYVIDEKSEDQRKTGNDSLALGRDSERSYNDQGKAAYIKQKGNFDNDNEPFFLSSLAQQVKRETEAKQNKSESSEKERVKLLARLQKIQTELEAGAPIESFNTQF